jgi:hypothetical protein
MVNNTHGLNHHPSRADLEIGGRLHWRTLGKEIGEEWQPERIGVFQKKRE